MVYADCEQTCYEWELMKLRLALAKNWLEDEYVSFFFKSSPDDNFAFFFYFYYAPVRITR